uniref:SFRICE_037939 n=1 Tax=Spodoptera frugiperda TaxID=7108 RepID=A0A2H1VHJ8_SPOFR
MEQNEQIGSCDVAGGAGSVNALPAGSAGARLAPSFDAATPRNVTALVGKSAYLSCRVRNLGNRTNCVGG